MKTLSPNTLLQNRYLVVQLIGKGGMGEVYLAVDQRLGSAVALKRTFFTDDESLGGAFEREAKTLARLRHPVLPKVSDHFTEDGNQYLVMDHISGDDLSKRLESAKKPFPLNWVLFWADQLLDALNYLHSYNPPIVHRDIKPQNLKLTDDNHIVLLDFGLAKDNVGNTRVTSSGSVVGFTPHYAPMEQIRGVGTNPKSDIYSLSATLYQLLTNTVPPDALSRADILLGKMPDPLIPVNELNPEVSKPIADTIAKGMSLSLDQRLSTAREMQKLLRDGYAQMQNAMTAQTVAFNLGTEKKEGKEIEQPEIEPPIAEKLDQFATIVNENPVSPSVESGQNLNSIGDKTEQMNFADISAKTGDSAPLEHISKPKQSDVRTEVFLAGSSDLPPLENKSADGFKSSESYQSSNIEFTKDSNSENAIPFVSYNGESENLPSEVPSAFDSVQVSGGSAEEGFNFSPSEDFSDVKVNSEYNAVGAGYTQPNYDVPDSDYTRNSEEFVERTPPNEKSGGKGAFIAGGIFLLLLIVGAAGAGWYFYNNSKEVVEEPKPSPQTAPSSMPTPEPTVADANIDDSKNTNFALTGNSNADNTNNQPVNSTIVTDPASPRLQPTPFKTPFRPSNPQPTPFRTPPPPKKEPTPKKDDRTVPLP